MPRRLIGEFSPISLVPQCTTLVVAGSVCVRFLREMGVTKTGRCLLCGEIPVVFYEMDDASLCLNCDKIVHGANAIAECHERRVILGSRLERRGNLGSASFADLSPVNSHGKEQQVEATGVGWGHWRSGKILQ
jgi:hypothetical protein